MNAVFLWTNRPPFEELQVTLKLNARKHSSAENPRFRRNDRKFRYRAYHVVISGNERTEFLAKKRTKKTTNPFSDIQNLCQGENLISYEPNDYRKLDNSLH